MGFPAWSQQRVARGRVHFPAHDRRRGVRVACQFVQSGVVRGSAGRRPAKEGVTAVASAARSAARRQPGPEGQGSGTQASQRPGSADPASSRADRAVTLVETNGTAPAQEARAQEAPASPEREDAARSRRRKNSGGRGEARKAAGRSGSGSAPGGQGGSGIVSEDPDLAAAGSDAVGLAEVTDLTDVAELDADVDPGDVDLAEDVDAAELENLEVDLSRSRSMWSGRTRT